jgi:hypothetical protein
MNRIVFICILLNVISARNNLPGTCLRGFETILLTLTEQDTLKEYQSIYTGRTWTNKYRRINGDQFLFTNYFLPGTVSANGKIFKNLLIRYDINSDEIMVPVSRDEILQLNKEMVDSFSINFKSQTYRFTNILNDSQNVLKGIKSFNGYFLDFYKGGSALYIKYIKNISPNITDKSDGEFIQTQKIFLVKDKIVYPIKTRKDLYKALDADKGQLRNWIKSNMLKVSMKNPESLIPIIKYYDKSRQ